MYSIVRLLNGKFQCIIQIQDEIERWEEPTEKAAIKAIKRAGNICNHTKNLKKKEINFINETFHITKTEIEIIQSIRAGTLKTKKVKWPKSQ